MISFIIEQIPDEDDLSTNIRKSFIRTFDDDTLVSIKGKDMSIQIPLKNLICVEIEKS